MKRFIFLIALPLLTVSGLKAQNEIDALRYSRLNYSGSARFVSMGGAFGALGADFTSLSHNPAGIGLYRSSEIVLTPSISINNSEAVINGSYRDDSRYNFNLGNVGIIMNNSLEKKNPQSAWRNIQFGFGLNRMANFNNRVSIDNDNNYSSYLSSYPGAANGKHPGDLGAFDTRLAYNTDLLLVTDSATWQYGVDKPYGGVNQRKLIDSKGSINEMVFTLGGNYMDRLYLGATIGIPNIRYSETATYTETALAGDTTVFSGMTRTDMLETNGTGVNFKFGLIFRATDWLRLGGAIHTPTFFSSMADDYTSTLRSRFDNGYTASAKASGYYEYELNTPMRAIASVGVVIGKSGIISADYEYVNYAKARLRAPDYDFYDENNAIREIYQAANNFRLGTEWRYGALNFRGGYALSANPYVTGINSAMPSYSLGLGIRERSFYIDLGWVYSEYDDEYYLYSGIESPARTTISNNTFMLTLGIKY